MNDWIKGDLLWEKLPDYFLRVIKIMIDDSVFKTGQFMNIKIVGNACSLKLKGENKTIGLPTPYKFRIDGNSLFLDYTIESLIEGRKNLKPIFYAIKKKNRSVFYNKVVKIEIS